MMFRNAHLFGSFDDRWPQKNRHRTARLLASQGACGQFPPPPISGSLPRMFVIELVYKADLAEIDAHMSAHVAFLKKYYASGNFLVSGRKIPRDGGIILAVGKSKEQIEGIIREDPFHKH